MIAEPLLYHDETRRGFFSVLVGGRQSTYRLDELPAVLHGLPKEEEVFIEQAENFRPNRRLVHLARLPLLFADLDTHKTRYGSLSPDQQAMALRLHCEEQHLPRPSVINYSGRGLHAKWLLDSPLPNEALPRWNATERALADGLEEFGVDRGALDGTRCLRHVDSVNPKSQERTRILWMDEQNGQVTRWNFETLASDLLPLSRPEVRERQATKAVRKVASRAEVRNKNLMSERDLMWSRLTDLRTLIQLRGYPRGVVPIGDRNNFLFVAVGSVASVVPVETLEAEISALANEFTGTLSPSSVKRCVCSVLARARQGNPYRLKSERIVEMLNITPAEQNDLRTLISDDKRRERDRKRHRAQPDRDRALYLAEGQIRTDTALQLRKQGLSYQQIAERVGCSVGAVKVRIHRANQTLPHS